MFLIFLFALFISSYKPVVKTFNLDIISPDLRTGPSNSLFGFSVVSSSTKPQWYSYQNSMICDYSLYFIGLMLVHLEHYLLDNGPLQFYLTVLKLYQMIVYLVIFLNAQMLQMNVGHFLLKVK